MKFFCRNLLLTKEKNIKIAGFDMSRIIDPDTISVRTRVGTIPYMSPEIKAGNEYDYKTDIWYASFMLLLKTFLSKIMLILS